MTTLIMAVIIVIIMMVKSKNKIEEQNSKIKSKPNRLAWKKGSLS